MSFLITAALLLHQSLKQLLTIPFHERYLHLYISNNYAGEDKVNICSAGLKYYIFSTKSEVDCKRIILRNESIEYCNDPWFSHLFKSPGVVIDIQLSLLDIIGCNISTTSARNIPKVSIFNVIKDGGDDDYYLSYGDSNLVSQLENLHISSVAQGPFEFQKKSIFTGQSQRKKSLVVQNKILSLSAQIFLHPVNHIMNFDNEEEIFQSLCIQFKQVLAPIKYLEIQSFNASFSSIYFSHPFMVTSENPTLFQPWNLKDLILQCGYEPPLAHLRPVAPISMGYSRAKTRSSHSHQDEISSLSIVDSKCSILHVEVGSSQRGRRQQQQQQQDSLPCIEDFLDLVPIARYYINNNSSNILTYENFSHANGEPPLHFVTTLGHVPSRDVGDIDYSVKLSFFEFLAVIKAFMNTKYHTIKVLPLTGIFDPTITHKPHSGNDMDSPKRITSRIKQLFVNTILIFTVDSNRDGVASRILSDLQAIVSLSLLKVLNNSSSENLVPITIANEQYYHDIVRSLVKSFHAYIINPGTFNICQQENPEESLLRSKLYLCENADFRNQLAHTLGMIPVIDDAHFRYLQTLLAYLPILTQLSPSLEVSSDDLIAVSVTQVKEVHPLSHSTISPSRSEEEKSSTVHISVDGDAYILLFVHPRHVPLAQFLVDHWQKNCDCHICFLFIKYLIVPIHSERYSEGIPHGENSRSQYFSDMGQISDDYDEGDYSMRHSKQSFVMMRPPLRLVLSYTQQFIKDVATKKDLIVILVGLEAIFSFRQPGLEHVDSCGLIPFIKYGQLLKYNLPSRIISSASLDRSGPSFHAIAGICSDMYDLINFVISRSRSTSYHYHSGDDVELKQLLRYSQLNSDIIDYDVSRHIFDAATLTYLLDDTLDIFDHNSLDNCENRIYRYSAKVIATLSKLIQSFLSNNFEYKYSDVSNNNGAPASITLFDSDYCEFLMLSCDDTSYSGNHLLRLPTRENLALKIHQLGFPKVRHVEHTQGSCDQVNFKSMEDVLHFLGDSLIMNGRWVDAFLYIHYIIQESIECDDFYRFRDITYHQFLQCAKQSRIANKEVSISEFEALAMLNEAYLQHYTALVVDELVVRQRPPGATLPVSGAHMNDLERAVDALECVDRTRCEYIKSLQSILLPLHIAISSLWQETASYHHLVSSMQASLGEDSFVDVDLRRKQWLMQRRYLNRMMQVAQATATAASAASAVRLVSHNPIPSPAEVRIEDIVRVHVVTYSSEDNDDLQALLTSAYLAGIEVQVLGLDGNYVDYSAKLLAYCDYILESPDLDEEDYILFIDAFDVLVFPRLQHDIFQYMAQSPYPIVFCVENGIYPEFATSFLYTRHTGMPTVNEAKFLNSGCMLGRIGQTKKMFRYAKKYALSIRDDQQIFVRYLLQHSDEVGLDMASALFLTTHKQSSSSAAFQWLPDLDFMFRNRSIGLVHFNNKQSNGLYALYSQLVRRAEQMFFHGVDGQPLLMSIRLLASGRSFQAEEILSWSVIQNNRTSNGGSNPIGDYLMQKILADRTEVST